MDFWDNHGIIFLLGLTFFPRITTLFFMATPFGLVAWLGWIFAPHFLVAFYASFKYWDQNPGLVIMAWIIAFIGTGSEGKVADSARR
jgi:uncharacterized membrane protein YGL010W